MSLHTTDRSVALTRLDDARREIMRRFAEPDAPTPASGIFSRSLRPLPPVDESLPLLAVDQAAHLARRFFLDAMRGIDAEPRPPAGWSSDEAAMLRAELETRLARLTGSEPADGIDDVADAMRLVLRSAGVCAVEGSEACNALHNFMRRAMAQAAAIRLARANGDFSDRISDALFQAASTPSALLSEQPSARRSEATLGEVMDRYLAEVLNIRSVTPKTSLKHQSLLHHVGAFFGRDTPICDIERTDCTRFRDTLAKLPPNFAKRQKGRTRTLVQIAEGNVDGPALAWETQNNYLKMMDDLMGWALQERLLPDNVASAISPLKKREAADTQRLPFNARELAAIFAQPVFTGCLDDERRYAMPGPHVIRRSRYWVPLIALFTGMRMGEILHLTTDHVRVSAEGTQFIVLTRDMRLKTESAEREIPIHPMLLKLGFVDWVEAQRKAGVVDLFDEVPVSKHGYRSDMFSKRFATFLKRVHLAENRKAKLCFHSFRHTFKDALNETGAPEAEMDEVCGWSRGKKTGRRYGSGLSADRLKAYVERVAFEVDFDRVIAVASSATDG